MNGRLVGLMLILLSLLVAAVVWIVTKIYKKSTAVQLEMFRVLKD